MKFSELSLNRQFLYPTENNLDIFNKGDLSLAA